MTEIRSAEQRAGVCESVPYHLVSAVQPHAVLIAAEQGSLAVRRATRNVERLAGLSFPDLFGTPFQDLIEAESRDRLMRLLDSPGGPLHRGGRVATDLRFEPRLGGRSGVAVLYFSPPLLCIEFHPDIEEVRSGESLDTLLFRLVEEIPISKGRAETWPAPSAARCRPSRVTTGCISASSTRPDMATSPPSMAPGPCPRSSTTTSHAPTCPTWCAASICATRSG